MPVQVPGSAVSVWPSSGVPEIDGGVELAGASASTSVESEDVAVSLPPAFVAVTTTRIVPPTSAETSW